MIAHPIVMAKLVVQEGQQPSIQFEDAELCSTLHSHEDYPTVDSFELGNGGSGAGYVSVSNEKRRKAVCKCVNAAITLAQLCNETASGDGSTRGMKWRQDRGLPSMTVEEMVVITEETLSKAQGIAAHSSNMFVPIEFRFPGNLNDRQLSLKSKQYLHISLPRKSFNESLFTERNRPFYEHIDIVSGICIFNQSVLKASISDPKSAGVDLDKLKHTKPTMYEMEYIARSSSAIADMASMIISRIREHESTILVHIGLDVPSFQYYQSIIAKSENGLCSTSEVLTWMDAVDLRHNQIAEVFNKSVRHELQQRGIKPGSYEICASSGTNLVSLFLRKSLQNQEIPSLESVLQRLDDEEGGLWRNFYQLIPTKDRPREREDLNHLFYVFQVVKRALMETATRCQSMSMVERNKSTQSTFKDLPDPGSVRKTRRLIISIDEPLERRIYSRSQEVLKKIRKSPQHLTDPTLIELYLCRRVFVHGNRDGNDLYKQDPMPEAFMLSHPSEHNSKNGGQLVEASEVVRRLHGSARTQTLKKLFAQTGLSS